MTDGLLERDRELATFAELVGAPADGRLAIIEGHAGVGKSALLAEIRARAASAGLRVLAARGSVLEREFAFGAVRQLFEPLLTDPDDRARLLAGAAAPASRVFDSLDESETSFSALHSLFWLTANVAADAPTLLAVDDLHWCDRPSLRFLAYLMQRVEGQPVIAVGTIRTGDPGTDKALLGDLRRDALVVAPGPLSGPAAAALVRSVLGAQADAAFCAACHAATGGNPLLLRQLVRALESEAVPPDAAHLAEVREIGARAVAQSVEYRLARMSAAALDVARAVAVLGDGASVAMIADLAGLEPEAVADATGELARAEVLRPQPPLGFVHALVRDAIYQGMSPGERELRHARAVDLLERAGAPAEQIAAQLLEVPPAANTRIVGVLQAAARNAVQRGGPDSAVALLRRALREPPADEHRGEILVELGIAESMLDADSAVEHLGEALEITVDTATRAQVGELLAKTLVFTGRGAEAAEVAARVAAELPASMDDGRRRLQAQMALVGHFGHVDPLLDEVLAGCDALPLAGDAGSSMLALVAAADMMLRGAPAADCVALTRAALTETLYAADDGGFSVGGVRILAICDDDEALAYAERQRLEANRRGSAFGTLASQLWHGFALLRRGELEDAAAAFASSISEGLRWHIGNWRFGVPQLSRVQLEQGDPAAARATLGRMDPPEGAIEVARWWRGLDLELLLAEGRAEAALAAADELARLFPRVQNPGAVTWRSGKARALHRLGRTAEALALADEDVALAQRFGAPTTIGQTLRLRGLLRDDLEDLRAAVAALETTSSRLELAKALAAEGAALRRHREPTEAREPLRRALDLADACGARGLVEEVRTELRASGVRPRTAALAGVEALTASERRAADLAACGATNRDIAQMLFVTPKTVELHLSSCYRKLGISSRRELPQALAASPAHPAP